MTRPSRSRRNGMRRASNRMIGVSAARNNHSLLEKSRFGHGTRRAPASRACKYESSALSVAGTRHASAMTGHRSRVRGMGSIEAVATATLYSFDDHRAS